MEQISNTKTTKATTTQGFLRLSEHAPHGGGVQGLRPLRGQASGRPWTPPPNRRAHNTGGDPQRQLNTGGIGT